MYTRPLRSMHSSHASIREAMACIDRNAKEIALVVDEQDLLMGTVTDGDIRRAILAAFDLDSPVKKLLENRACKPETKACHGTERNVGARTVESHETGLPEAHSSA